MSRSELGLFSVSITLHGFKCCSALFASFWLIRHILSPFFFPFLPPLWSASWIEPKPPTPSLFSLSLASSRLSSYIILHQYVYLRSRAPHHCLCQTTENEMGRTTQKKTKKKSSHSSASGLCGISAHTATRWGKAFITTWGKSERPKCRLRWERWVHPYLK